MVSTPLNISTLSPDWKVTKFTNIAYKIIQNFKSLKTCLSRYDVMIFITFENILKHTIIKYTHIQVIMHKLYKSKSGKSKQTDSH